MPSAPISVNKVANRDFDTGFPVSLASRTTSLRHPEANTAPGVCIIAEDINPVRTQQQSCKPLRRKAKRTISHDKMAFEAPAPQKDLNLTVAPPNKDSEFGTVK